MATPNITAELLRTLIHYDPSTGEFTRIAHVFSETGRRSGQSKLGPMTRKPNIVGYIVFSVNRTSVLAHRLAWMYMTGDWPPGVIDHINGERADNRWENLRLSDATLNQQNQRKAKAGSVVDLLGVSVDKESGKYIAQITHNYRHIHLGRFDTAVEAYAAYLGAKRVIHKACTI